MRPRFNEAGFTLVEMILVISITAIVGSMVATFLAVPMQALGPLLDQSPQIGNGQPLVACCKGVDLETLRGPVALILLRRPGAEAAILTGPSFAADIAKADKSDFHNSTPFNFGPFISGGH